MGVEGVNGLHGEIVNSQPYPDEIPRVQLSSRAYPTQDTDVEWVAHGLPFKL